MLATLATFTPAAGVTGRNCPSAGGSVSRDGQGDQLGALIALIALIALPDRVGFQESVHPAQTYYRSPVRRGGVYSGVPSNRSRGRSMNPAQVAIATPS